MSKNQSKYNTTGLYRIDKTYLSSYDDKNMLREWSLLIMGTGVERDLSGVPKPVVIFYWAMESFVRFLPGYQNLLPKILKSMRH